MCGRSGLDWITELMVAVVKERTMGSERYRRNGFEGVDGTLPFLTALCRATVTALSLRMFLYVCLRGGHQVMKAKQRTRTDANAFGQCRGIGASSTCDASVAC